MREGGGGSVGDSDVAVRAELLDAYRPLLDELEESEEGDDDIHLLTFGAREVFKRKRHGALYPLG